MDARHSVLFLLIKYSNQVTRETRESKEIEQLEKEEVLINLSHNPRLTSSVVALPSQQVI